MVFQPGRSPDFASSSRSLPVRLHSGFERSSALQLRGQYRIYTGFPFKLLAQHPVKTIIQFSFQTTIHAICSMNINNSYYILFIKCCQLSLKNVVIVHINRINKEFRWNNLDGIVKMIRHFADVKVVETVGETKVFPVGNTAGLDKAWAYIVRRSDRAYRLFPR